jgi:hypothetical protein
VRKADDVLRYIHAAMFFCPADHFDPGGKGGWLISQEGYRNLPPEIRCLVDEMEMRTVKTPAGSVSTLWVRFVSKATAMTLAAKHQLGEKVAVTQTHPWWEILANGIPDGPVEDEVEIEIERRLSERSASEAPVNRLVYVPSANGNGHQSSRRSLYWAGVATLPTTHSLSNPAFAEPPARLLALG